MVSLNHICVLFQYVGAINFHRFSSVWKNKLQSVYVFLNAAVMSAFVLSHLLSTFTRAIRYRPEFIQALVEDCLNILLMFGIFYFQLTYRKLNNLTDFTEVSFSKAYPNIYNKCMSESHAVLKHFCIFVLVALSGSILETMLSISETELEIRRYVYRTKHPERRLPYNVRVPFLDETETCWYEILYATSVYITFVYWTWSTLVFCLIPIIVIHVRGQYDILCKYVTMIGSEHKDSEGYRIYYTSIEDNQYLLQKDMKDGTRKKGIGRDNMNAIYERVFLRQIVMFHKKLMSFRSEVSTRYIVNLSLVPFKI